MIALHDDIVDGRSGGGTPPELAGGDARATIRGAPDSKDKPVLMPSGAGAPRLAADDRRRRREWVTMEAMIGCHCRGRHGTRGDLCQECEELRDYAARRLERCHFGAEKPACARCPVHCYQRQWRERIKAVMRYAGPRMVWRHPVLSLLHWRDGWRGRMTK